MNTNVKIIAGLIVIMVTIYFLTRRIMNPKFSEHFTLADLLVTGTGLTNKPNEQEVENLRLLTVNVLQPIRDLLGTEVIVNSAFRSAAVNAKVGGAHNSQHRLGFAADIRVPKMDLMQAYTKIAKSSIPYDQLIFEIKPGNVKWIHVSFNPVKRRKELLLAEWDNTKNKMSYKPLTV